MSLPTDPVAGLIGDADKTWNSALRSLHSFRRTEDALARLEEGVSPECSGLPDMRLLFPAGDDRPAVEVEFPVTALDPSQIRQVLSPLVQAEKLWFLDALREVGEKLRSVYASVYETLQTRPGKEAEGADS